MPPKKRPTANSSKASAAKRSSSAAASSSSYTLSADLEARKSLRGDDCLVSVFAFLSSTADLLRARLVSRQWRTAAEQVLAGRAQDGRHASLERPRIVHLRDFESRQLLEMSYWARSIRFDNTVVTYRAAPVACLQHLVELRLSYTVLHQKCFADMTSLRVLQMCVGAEDISRTWYALRYLDALQELELHVCGRRNKEIMLCAWPLIGKRQLRSLELDSSICLVDGPHDTPLALWTLDDLLAGRVVQSLANAPAHRRPALQRLVCGWSEYTRRALVPCTGGGGAGGSNDRPADAVLTPLKMLVLNPAPFGIENVAVSPRPDADPMRLSVSNYPALESLFAHGSVSLHDMSHSPHVPFAPPLLSSLRSLYLSECAFHLDAVLPLLRCQLQSLSIVKCSCTASEHTADTIRHMHGIDGWLEEARAVRWFNLTSFPRHSPTAHDLLLELAASLVVSRRVRVDARFAATPAQVASFRLITHGAMLESALDGGEYCHLVRFDYAP